jgi:death-on-curing protein
VNHPFVDGNKRIGAAVAELFLSLNGADVLAGDDELVAITLAAARGEVSAEALSIWLRQRTRRREG